MCRYVWEPLSLIDALEITAFDSTVGKEFVASAMIASVRCATLWQKRRASGGLHRFRLRCSSDAARAPRVRSRTAGAVRARSVARGG
jgi:hypothetical protein